MITLPNYPGYIYLIENEDSITHKVSLKTLNGFLGGYRICETLLNEYNSDTVKKQLFDDFITMSIFILVKLDNLTKGIKILYDFEESLDFDIKLGSRPLKLVNNKIKNGQFTQAKILLKLMGILHNNKKIRNLIFIKYSDLKLLKEDI